MTRDEAVALVQRILDPDYDDEAQASAWLEELGRSLGCTAGHVGGLIFWPVGAPPGREPLPANAHVLKALDTDTIYALYEEAAQLRLGLGKGGPWLRAHLARDAVHYLVPDPARYYWPGNADGRGGKIRWRQCTALLRMHDGEQVSNMIAVMPETFTALPSTLARREQVRLVNLARNTNRDTYLWGAKEQ